MADFLTWIEQIPPLIVYILLGIGAAIENVLPAVPADTFVALGGLLSSVGNLDPRWIFLSTWLLNVVSALVMYRIGYTHGRPFFDKGWGRHVLRPHQVERMHAFYRTFGTSAIFITRFLPGFRSVVPVFAGVSHHPFLHVAIPIALASAIWYGALIWLGRFAGQNLDVLQRLLGSVNSVLVIVATGVALGVGIWWWRTRHPPRE